MLLPLQWRYDEYSSTEGNILLRVLFGFRKKRIAIGIDLMEMFHQIQNRPTDRHALRLLWRENPSQKPDVYLIDVATFRLRNWLSNSKEVLLQVGEDQLVLSGYESSYKATSLTSCSFDAAGMLCFFVVFGKILIQKRSVVSIQRSLLLCSILSCGFH